MSWDQKYFVKFEFAAAQIKQILSGALKDAQIAKMDEILDVKFNYSYTAFIKSGLALVAFLGYKLKSMPGHHVKIIEKMSEILKDGNVDLMGNVMRTKRNLDLYAGTWEITEKECEEYQAFSDTVLARVKKIIHSK